MSRAMTFCGRYVILSAGWYDTNTVPAGAFRGHGLSQTEFAPD